MQYKINTIALAIVGMVIAFAACGSKIDDPSPPVYTGIHTIKINAEQELQTVDGFGASDAWRCQMVGKY